MMSKIMSDQIASTVSDAVDSTAAVVPVQATLSVIIPAFNEVGTVAEILRRVLQQSVVSEIVFVDDGSTDGTWDAVQQFIEALPADDLQRVVAWQHAANRGKGRAIRTGLEHVTGTHVLIQDADLEYDPADIDKLWKVMQSGDADVVFGSRYLDNPNLQQGRFVLQSGVRFLNLLTRLLYGIRLTDQATCYKLFRTTDLRSFNLNCERFEFCAEVTAKASLAHRRIVEKPIAYHHRNEDQGKKLRASDGLIALWTLFRCWLFRPSDANETLLSDTSSRNKSRSMLTIAVAATSLLGLIAFFVVFSATDGPSDGNLSVVAAPVIAVPEHDFPQHDSQYPRQDSPRDMDLGRLRLGQQPEFVFAVQNQTDQPFQVTRVRTTCSCDHVEVTEGAIVEPGDFLRVPYKLKSNSGGLVDGRVTVSTSSSAADFTQFVFKLQARIPKVLWCVPESIHLNNPQDTSTGDELIIHSDIYNLVESRVEISSLRGTVDLQVIERTADWLRLAVKAGATSEVRTSHDLIRVVVSNPDVRTADLKPHSVSTTTRVMVDNLSVTGGSQ